MRGQKTCDEAASDAGTTSGSGEVSAPGTTGGAGTAGGTLTGNTTVHGGTVAAVRAFNRFYTNVIGLLRGKYLGTPYSLTESRLLFEWRSGRRARSWTCEGPSTWTPGT